MLPQLLGTVSTHRFRKINTSDIGDEFKEMVTVVLCVGIWLVQIDLCLSNLKTLSPSYLPSEPPSDMRSVHWCWPWIERSLIRPSTNGVYFLFLTTPRLIKVNIWISGILSVPDLVSITMETMFMGCHFCWITIMIWINEGISINTLISWWTT